VVRLARERPRYDAPDRVFAREDLSGGLTRGIQLIERHGVLVSGDLEHRVRRGVDDPLPRPLVLLPELLDDLRARGRLVAEDAPPGAVHERIDDVMGEPVRIRRKRLRRDDAHVLPVTRGRVLALRALEQASGDGGSARLWPAPLERLHIAEAERLEARQVETA